MLCLPNGPLTLSKYQITEFMNAQWATISLVDDVQTFTSLFLSWRKSTIPIKWFIIYQASIAYLMTYSASFQSTELILYICTYSR